MRNTLSPFALMLGAALSFALPHAASAQLGLPGVQVPPVPEAPVNVNLPDAEVAERLAGLSARTQRRAIRLLNSRDQMLDRLLSRNRDVIERDARGDLARRGELLATGLNEAQLLALIGQGFVMAERDTIEGLELDVVRLTIPQALDLSVAEALARSLARDADISPDHLHYQAAISSSSVTIPAFALQSSASIGTEVGMIDGAPSASVSTVGKRGFAKGAPHASNHGSAVASLLKRAGVRKVRVADVYGTDPAAGNALAIARAIGWLTKSGSKVITISLVGPRNGLVAKAIAAAQSKGVIVVAAVGNDGPAAPPAYPASYGGVVAVTGVDKRGRALIEAGRANGLDYAAPGADIHGLNSKGKQVKLRGTSFAAPLAAARIAAARQRSVSWRGIVDKEARDLGKKGPDTTYGRGLLCGGCAKKK